MNQPSTTYSESSPLILDAKGLKCPMPVIKLQQAVRQSQVGDFIQVECTDPSAEKDIQSWARVNKHIFVSATPTKYGFDILIQVQPR